MSKISEALLLRGMAVLLNVAALLLKREFSEVAANGWVKRCENLSNLSLKQAEKVGE